MGEKMLRAKESLVQAVSSDCKGMDDENNGRTTWGAHEVPSKCPVMSKGLTVFLPVISPP